MSSRHMKFHGFELNPSSYELCFKGTAVKLERIPMEVLLLLASRCGELVERSEIVEKLWGNNVFVDTDNSINTAIRKIRLALGDDPDQPRFILTVPGRGYRFIARVEAMEVDQGVPSKSSNGAAKAPVSGNVPASEKPRESAVVGLLRKQKWGALLPISAALVLGVVLYAGHRLRGAKLSPETITHRQFTFLGNAYAPAISPDGMYVAYVMKMASGEQRLMVQGSSGSPVELARGTGMDSPGWSPDGSELLFVERRSNGAKGSVFLVSRLGGVVRPLAEAESACWFDPKGTQIVTANLSGPSGFRGVRLMNRLTGEMKEIRLPDYEWLLDVDCSARTGGILAATVKSDKYQIWAFKADGSAPRKLVEGDGIFSPRWCPSGEAIYFMRAKGSTSEMVKLSIGGRDQKTVVLASGLQTGGTFTLAADGSRLAYTRKADNSNLWRISLPTSEKPKAVATRLTSGTSYHGAPSFSPDGHWIAFTFGPNGEGSNVFKMSAADGTPVQLTFFEHATASGPVFSPDGRRIAFISDQSGAPKVWTIPADGGLAQILENTNAADSHSRPSWWPAAEILYQQPGFRNLMQINGKTHEQRAILKNEKSLGVIPNRPIPSPDGKRIALYSIQDDAAGLWIISLQPYYEISLKRDVWPIGWSPDGRYIYAMRGVEAHEILRVQVDSPHEVVSVAGLPDEVAETDGASVSADGKEVVVTVSEEISDVWLMENFDPSRPAARNPIQ